MTVKFINPFEGKAVSFPRDLDLLANARANSAYYLSKTTGKGFERCLAFVNSQTQIGERVKDRDVLTIVKNRHGDRITQENTFYNYINGIANNGHILAPNMVSYVRPEVEESLLSKYVEGNVKLRKLNKNEQFAAKRAGNVALEKFKNIQQTGRKLTNNAMSGGHVSSSTPLANPSAHSVLTSTCRSATSYGNAFNEKFLAGNRHYSTPELAEDNILSICRLSDSAKIMAVMEHYELVFPNVEQVKACIHYSLDLYYRDATGSGLVSLYRLIDSLTPLERAMVMYVGDFYHLAELNPEFVRGFLSSFIIIPEQPVENPDVWFGIMDSDLRAYTSLLCADIVGLKGIGDDLRAKSAVDYGRVAGVVKNVTERLHDFSDLIDAFWTTRNLPNSVANIRSIIRRAVVASDTDSTIFTVQHWTKWYTGSYNFSQESFSIAWIMIYLSSQGVAHTLATMSRNLGIPDHKSSLIGMKNEFAFPVFSLTSRAKHYYAYQMAQEGIVFEEYETEIKGVALRNSNVPPAIMRKQKQLLHAIMDTVLAERKIKIFSVIKEVVKLEWDIRKSVASGSFSTMTKGQVKDPASYKLGEKASGYSHYGMWNDVFGPKYGRAEDPPYSAIKISIDVNNKTDMADWLDRISDKALAERLTQWMARSGKAMIKQLMVPESIVSAGGVPEEIIEGVNVRKMIYGSLESFYMIVESLGYTNPKSKGAAAIPLLFSDIYFNEDFDDVPDFLS